MSAHLNVTNRQFLQGLFGIVHERAWVTGRRYTDEKGWGGGLYAERSSQVDDRADLDTYVCVSIFRADDEGGIKRDVAHFDAQMVLMADDLGSKMPMGLLQRLPPCTALVETSPGNHQAWWRLAEPAHDAAQLQVVFDALTAASNDGTDPGHKSVTRYGRLPTGTNSKPIYNGGHGVPVRLAQWNPENEVTLDEFAQALGIDDLRAAAQQAAPALDATQGRRAAAEVAGAHPVIRAFQSQDMLRRAHPDPSGWWPVVCPWESEHSTIDDRTHINIHAGGGWGFRCFHGHCEQRRVADVRAEFRSRFGIELPPGIDPSPDGGNGGGARAAPHNDPQSREPDQRDGLRRDRQRAENRAIGADRGTDEALRAPLVTVETMLAEYVFIANGSQVARIDGVGGVLAMQDFRNITASSKTSQKRKRGDKEVDVQVPNALIWLHSPERVTVHTLTYAPGHRTFTSPPSLPFERALNLWKPLPPIDAPQDYQHRAAPFVEHVRWLWGVAADAFLDWLAHHEQAPGVLPHAHWLHVAPQQGMGRNWIASVLARIWSGRVAASLDLVALTTGSFNDEISQKTFAIVDEVQDAPGVSFYQASQRLKAMTTQETTDVNPKYGRKRTEYNVRRWLLFSNHWSALALNRKDRRFNVASCEERPRPPSYYTALYRLLADPVFLCSVRAFLAARDIGGFNPGAPPARTVARDRVIAETMALPEALLQRLVDAWPCDLITANVLTALLRHEALGDPKTADDANSGRFPKFNDHQFERTGVVFYGTGNGGSPRKIKAGGTVQRIYILRNADRWQGCEPSGLGAELARRVPLPGPQSGSAIELDLTDSQNGVAVLNALSML